MLTFKCRVCPRFFMQQDSAGIVPEHKYGGEWCPGTHQKGIVHEMVQEPPRATAAPSQSGGDTKTSSKNPVRRGNSPVRQPRIPKGLPSSPKDSQPGDIQPPSEEQPSTPTITTVIYNRPSRADRLTCHRSVVCMRKQGHHDECLPHDDRHRPPSEFELKCFKLPTGCVYVSGHPSKCISLHQWLTMIIAPGVYSYVNADGSLHIYYGAC